MICLVSALNLKIMTVAIYNEPWSTCAAIVTLTQGSYWSHNLNSFMTDSRHNN